MTTSSATLPLADDPRNQTAHVVNTPPESSVYQIYPQSNVVVQFRIGKPCPVLDAFLESQAIEYAVFVSAHNPHGLKQPAINNTIAHHQLTALLKSEFWEFFSAVGGPQDQTGTPQPAVFILNMDRAEGADIARRFAQDTFIHIVKGRPPELVFVQKPPLN
jgi:hypothetical protein